MRPVRVVLVGATLLLAGCALVDQHEAGRQAGLRAVRDARAMNGPVGEAMLTMAEAAPWLPDPNRSAEWNGGFREGVQEALTHPDTQ